VRAVVDSLSPPAGGGKRSWAKYSGELGCHPNSVLKARQQGNSGNQGDEHRRHLSSTQRIVGHPLGCLQLAISGQQEAPRTEDWCIAQSAWRSRISYQLSAFSIQPMTGDRGPIFCSLHTACCLSFPLCATRSSLCPLPSVSCFLPTVSCCRFVHRSLLL